MPKDRDIELPDVQEFLKLSRTLLRQIKFFKLTNIPKEYIDVTNKAALKVKNELDEYLLKNQEID